MKRSRIVVFFALCLIAAVGCGQKDAAGDADELEPPEKTGNAVVDNLNSEPDMP